MSQMWLWCDCISTKFKHMAFAQGYIILWILLEYFWLLLMVVIFKVFVAIIYIFYVFNESNQGIQLCFIDYELKFAFIYDQFEDILTNIISVIH